MYSSTVKPHVEKKQMSTNMFYISKFCLLCLKEDDGTFEFVENKDSSGVSIQEKLDYCVFELVSSGHEFPGYICEECLNSIETFYNFKQKCFKNNRKIRSFMDSLKQMHFAGISYRDLSIPVENIKHKIFPLLKNETYNAKTLQKMPKIKFAESFNPENSKLNKSMNSYQCEKCPEHFYTKSSLKTHSLSHLKVKLFECKLCDKSYARIDSLTRHKKTERHKVLETTTKRIIEINNSVQCTLCPSILKNKNHLSRHYYKVHRNEKNLIQSYTGEDLDIVDLTEDEDDFDTASTSSTSNTASTSTAHADLMLCDEDIVHLKRNVFKIESARPKKFKRVLSLQPSKNHNINLYDMQNELVKDNNLSTEEDNFSCVVCDQSFSRNAKLLAHVQTHFDDDNYI